MFQVEYHPKVLKEDIKKISKPVLLVMKKAIEEKLQKNPAYFGKPLRNVLKNLWSLRVGKYRIIYEIQEKKLVVFVISMGKRETIYDRIK